MNRDRKALGSMIGIAVGGSAIVGSIGIIIGVVAGLAGSPVGAGLALVGAALAFGLLANALLRS